MHTGGRSKQDLVRSLPVGSSDIPQLSGSSWHASDLPRPHWCEGDTIPTKNGRELMEK